MKKNKVFLTLGLATMIALGIECIYDFNKDHTKDFCLISKGLNLLKLEEAAIKHQVDAINGTDRYTAVYTQNLNLFRGALSLQDLSLKPEVTAVLNDEFFIWYDYENGIVTSATKDNFIEVRENDIVVNELRIK